MSGHLNLYQQSPAVARLCALPTRRLGSRWLYLGGSSPPSPAPIWATPCCGMPVDGSMRVGLPFHRLKLKGAYSAALGLNGTVPLF